MMKAISTEHSPQNPGRDDRASRLDRAPVIGLALSGGGSRAMAFHLGCLRALNHLSLLDKVDVLSTISGGSVIGAYYAFTPEKSFAEFEADIKGFLRSGFQRAIAVELLKPTNLLPCLASFMISKASSVAAWLVGRPFQARRFKSRTDVFGDILYRRMFPGLTMRSPRRKMDVLIGACELRTGSAFRFGNEKSGDWRHGELDIENVPVAFAVAASAAYPIFLPGLDRTWWFQKNGLRTEHRIVLTDGGVYDNLGIQALEPGRDATVSLHSFPCDYLIVCNAGIGQDSGECIPIGFFGRVKRSFEVVHRRVQDGAMKRLHELADAKLIKGFAMPYLGQLDEHLPWTPDDLVKREAVASYATDFASMSDEWIDRLSQRGEQLTRILVPQYLRDIVGESILDNAADSMFV